MKPEKKPIAVKSLTEEDLISSGEISSEPHSAVMELFQAMTRDQQDEILRMILLDDGINRLLSAVTDTATPGAFDIFLDNVQYYHFFRCVKEDIFDRD